MRTLLALLVLSLCFYQSLSWRTQKQEVVRDLEHVTSFFQKMKEVRKVGDMSVPCALCGIAMNEIAGFLIENNTITEIEDLLRTGLCDHLGAVKEICDVLVTGLPLIIDLLENQWSVSKVCVDISLCSVPFEPHLDPQEPPRYVINLDLPPSERWNDICSVPLFQQNAKFLYQTITAILPGGSEIELLGEEINDKYFPTEYAQEIKGCSTKLGVPYGWVALFNLGYEVSDACTSIIAQTTDGKILHARNLDFWEGMGFTATLKNMTIQADYQKGGKTVFIATTFAGMVGVLSGIKPGAFSATVDTRFYPGGIGELFYEIIAAIEEKDAHMVSFLVRDVLENDNDFSSALTKLSNEVLIADVYYILAGVSAGQGAVITRNRTGADDIWLLNSPDRWFEVETNYDHWKAAPWFDNRIDPANKAMSDTGRDGLTLDKMFKVLTTKPVFNLQTTYTILSCPATGEYRSYIRYCPYPCVE